MFALWTNLDEIGEWISSVTKVTDVSGPIDTVGTTDVVHFGPVKSPTEILEVERLRRFATEFGELGAARSIERNIRARRRRGPHHAGIRARRSHLGGSPSWIFSRGSYEGSFRGELEKFARIAEREAPAD